MISDLTSEPLLQPVDVLLATIEAFEEQNSVNQNLTNPKTTNSELTAMHDWSLSNIVLKSIIT